MVSLREASTQRRYPLLYWITMAYTIGIPNFVQFDQSGRTANAINITSISMVVETVLVGYLLVALLLLERKPIRLRKIQIDTGLWIALFVVMLVATVLEPKARLVAVTPMQLLLSLFRLGQWVVAFVLIVALYTRTPAEHAKDFVIRFIGRASWIWLGMIWLLLPVMPSQVYGLSEENGASTARRLGGQLIGPAHAALLGSIAFFYALFFFGRGPRKWAACSLAVVTIVLTAARAQQAGFLLALFLYTIIYTKKPAIRWSMIGIGVLGLVLSVSLSEQVEKYVARGQKAQSLASLNDRTRVWQASFVAIKERPFIGYGFVSGARYAIRDHWKYAHWIPPHAHNEFIEAALAGGVLALLLTLSIYGRLMWRAIREAGRGPKELFLFLVLVQYALNTLTGTEISYVFTGTGGIFFLCYVAVLAGAKERAGLRRTIGQAASARPRQLEPSIV